jgi:cytochrome c peroxidase
MKYGLALSCSVLALLFVPACGGDPAPAANPGAAAPAPKNPPGDGVKAAPTPEHAPADATAQQPAAKKPTGPVRIDYEMVKRLFGMEPSAPAFDNPSTPEKVALGKALFHEKLSKNGNLSCASCHDLANYGQDGLPKATGADGQPVARNTPSVWNAARQIALYWDGRASTVEEQAGMHALEATGLGLADEAELVKKLESKPELVAAFGKAFPGGAAVTAKNFALALGAFERTLVTKSKFDAYLEGDQKALSNEEKLGLKNFQDIGCIQCHMQRLVGGAMMQKIGVLKPYPTEDIGRAKITGSDADKYIFKVPSLANVEKTAPYNHDGKGKTLEENVETMASVQLGKTLKPEEIASLVAFLKTLTGPLPKLE